MGSDSDLKIMEQAAAVLEELGVEVEMDVMSAHRTPEKVLDYSRSAYTRGVKVIIAGAGGAAGSSVAAPGLPCGWTDGKVLQSRRPEAPVYRYRPSAAGANGQPGPMRGDPAPMAGRALPGRCPVDPSVRGYPVAGLAGLPSFYEEQCLVPVGAG